MQNLFSLLSPDDLARAAQLWSYSNPRGLTHISSLDAASFLSKSGLPRDILQSVWILADPQGNGMIAFPGFAVAIRAITMAQNGVTDINEATFRAIVKVSLPAPNFTQQSQNQTMQTTIQSMQTSAPFIQQSGFQGLVAIPQQQQKSQILPINNFPTHHQQTPVLKPMHTNTNKTFNNSNSNTDNDDDDDDDGFGDLVISSSNTGNKTLEMKKDTTFGEIFPNRNVSSQFTIAPSRIISQADKDDDDDFGSFSSLSSSSSSSQFIATSQSQNNNQNQQKHTSQQNQQSHIQQQLQHQQQSIAQQLDSDPLSFSLLSEPEKERQKRAIAPLSTLNSINPLKHISSPPPPPLPPSLLHSPPLPPSLQSAAHSPSSDMDFFASLVEIPQTSLQPPLVTIPHPQTSLQSTKTIEPRSFDNDNDDFGEVISPPDQQIFTSSLPPVSIQPSTTFSSASPITLSSLSSSSLTSSSASTTTTQSGGIALKRGGFGSSFTSASSLTKASPSSSSTSNLALPSQANGKTSPVKVMTSLHNTMKDNPSLSLSSSLSSSSSSSSSSFFSDDFGPTPSLSSPPLSSSHQTIPIQKQSRQEAMITPTPTLSLSAFLSGASIQNEPKTIEKKIISNTNPEDQSVTTDFNFSSLKSVEVLFNNPPRVPDHAGDDEIVIAISTVSAGIDTVTSVVKEIQSALGLGTNASAISASPGLLSIKSLDSALNRLITADDLITRALTVLDSLPKSQATRKLRKDETFRASTLTEMIDEAKAVAGSAKDEVLRLQRVQSTEKAAAINAKVKSKAVDDLDLLFSAPSISTSRVSNVASPITQIVTSNFSSPSVNSRPALLRPPSSTVSPQFSTAPVVSQSAFIFPKIEEQKGEKNITSDPFSATTASNSTNDPFDVAPITKELEEDDGFGDFESTAVLPTKKSDNTSSLLPLTSSTIPPASLDINNSQSSPQHQLQSSSPTLIEDAFGHLDFEKVDNSVIPTVVSSISNSVSSPSYLGNTESKPVRASLVVQDVEEEDEFGDFGTSPLPQTQSLPSIIPPSNPILLRPPLPFQLVVEEEEDDDDDKEEDFGEFSAPVSMQSVPTVPIVTVSLKKEIKPVIVDDGFGDFNAAISPHDALKIVDNVISNADIDTDFGEFDEAPQPVPSISIETLYRKSSGDEFGNLSEVSELGDLDIKLDVDSNIPVQHLSDQLVSSLNNRDHFVSTEEKNIRIRNDTKYEEDKEKEEEEDAFSELISTSQQAEIKSDDDTFSELVSTPQQQLKLQEETQAHVFPDLLEEIKVNRSLLCASEVKKLSTEKALAIEEDRLEDALGLKKAIDDVKKRMTNQSIDEKSTLGFQVSLTQRCVDECTKLELVLASNSPSVSVQTVAAATQSTALMFSWACTGGGSCSYRLPTDPISQNSPLERPSRYSLPAFMSSANSAVKATKTWTTSVRSLLEQLSANASLGSSTSQKRDAVFKALSTSAPTASAFINLASCLRACTRLADEFFTARTLHRYCGKEAGISALPVLSLETQLLELAGESNSLVSSFPNIGLITIDSSGNVQSSSSATTTTILNDQSVSNAAVQVFVASKHLVTTIQNKANETLKIDSLLVKLCIYRTKALEIWSRPYSPRNISDIELEASAVMLFNQRGFSYISDESSCTLCGAKKGVDDKHNDCNALQVRLKD